MKRFAGLTFVLLSAGALFVACEREPVTPPDGVTPSLSEDIIAGRYIVVLQDGVDPAEIAEGFGVATTFEYRAALTGFSAEFSDDVRRAIEGNSLVRWVEPVKMKYLAWLDAASVVTPAGTSEPAAGEERRGCLARILPGAG